MTMLLRGISLFLLLTACSTGRDINSESKDFLGAAWSSNTGEIRSCLGATRNSAVACAQDKCKGDCDYAGSCAVDSSGHTATTVKGRSLKEKSFHIDLSCQAPDQLSERESSEMVGNCRAKGFDDCQISPFVY